MERTCVASHPVDTRSFFSRFEQMARKGLGGGHAPEADEESEHSARGNKRGRLRRNRHSAAGSLFDDKPLFKQRAPACG